MGIFDTLIMMMLRNCILTKKLELG